MITDRQAEADRILVLLEQALQDDSYEHALEVYEGLLAFECIFVAQGVLPTEPIRVSLSKAIVRCGERVEVLRAADHLRKALTVNTPRGFQAETLPHVAGGMVN